MAGPPELPWASHSQGKPASHSQGKPAQAGEEPPIPGHEPPQVSQAAALLRLVLVLVVAVGLAAAFHEMDLLLVIVAIVIIVMLHEGGHMLTAKLTGMKVTEYFLGFGPRVWSVRRGETTYGVKAIPAGGYVRIVGMTNLEEVDPADEPRSYREASFPRRIVVVMAGSIVHFLLALILLWVVLVFAGVPSNTGATVVAYAPVTRAAAPSPAHASAAADSQARSRVVPATTLATTPRGLPAATLAANRSKVETLPSPAREAGLVPGDRILAIAGHKVTSVGEAASIMAKLAPGRRVVFEVEKDGRVRDLPVVPISAKGVDLAGEPPAPGSRSVIGIEVTEPVVKDAIIPGIGGAVIDFGRAMGEVFGFFGSFFSLHGISTYLHEVSSPSYAAKAQRAGVQRPESIIGAVNTATQAARAGMGDLALVLVSINLFLGILNLLPLMPLDGGHVAIAVYERVRSRKGRPYHADAAKMAPLTYAVIMLLIFLGISAAYLDITHPVANPFR